MHAALRFGSGLLLFVGCASSAGDPAAGGGAGLGGASSAAGAASGGQSGSAPSSGAGGSLNSAGSANGGSSSASAGASGTAAAGNAGSGGSSAGAAGSSASAGAAACVTAGKQLCEDFESGQIDAQKWKLTKPTSSASITVDGQQVHSGQYAAHIKVEAGKQSTAMLTESVTFPATANSFYARAYLYFSPELPTASGGDFHMGFILGLGKNDLGDVQAGAGMIGGEKQYLGYSIFFGPPKYEFGPWSKAKVEPSKWQCLELFEDGSSPSEEKRQIWLDGVELADLRSTSNSNGAPANHKPPAFDAASFGLWEYHPSPLHTDVWIDDIRVSDKPIGCE